MRQLFAVALVVVVAVVAAPACAQRGGGGRGGFGGHAGFASRGGFSGVRSGHFAGGAFAPRYGAGMRAGAPMVRLVRPGVAGARPAFYHNGWERRREGRGYGAPYGYVGSLGYAYYAPDYGWLDANDPGYGDDYGDYGGYGERPYVDGSGVAAESYGEQVPENYVEQPEGYAQPMGQYQQPQSEAPSLFDSDAVTLVFKDGRAPERIHNYALTRTTLYVTDGRPREIPVAALDLAATEKANRAAGVSFQLPVTQ